MAKKKPEDIKPVEPVDQLDKEANGIIDDDIETREVPFSDGDQEEEQLCFVKFIGTNSDELNEYEFYFTQSIADVWGDNYNYLPAGLCNDITPFTDTYDKIVKCKLPFKLNLVQNNTQFSMQDCHDGCCALAWEDTSDYETYPEYRLVLDFGDSYDLVDNKMSMKGVIFDL